jgi:hypothetical protein
MMAVFSQQLGEKDFDLNKREEAHVRARSEKASVANSDITGLWMDGCMFVMCVYELTRSIDQRIRNDLALATVKAISLQAKKQLARVRMPLAKFQPAEIFRATDYSVAIPWMAADRSVAWEVSKGIVVSRRVLADAFLGLLMALPRRSEPPP